MLQVSLIRHGQAGSRTDYDRLSTAGQRQAALLGQWLARRGVRFDVAIVGGLERQKETARIALEQMRECGAEPPPLAEDPRWSEFDIDSVFAAIAPQLAARDAAFSAWHERLQENIRNGLDHAHREWTTADTQVVRSWIEGEFETGCETWNGFTERVLEALHHLPQAGRIAVFTSATPAGICVSHCFDSVHPTRIMHLAGAALNTNITSVFRQNGLWHLGGFNHIPHLDDQSLWTYR